MYNLITKWYQCILQVCYQVVIVTSPWYNPVVKCIRHTSGWQTCAHVDKSACETVPVLSSLIHDSSWSIRNVFLAEFLCGSGNTCVVHLRKIKPTPANSTLWRVSVRRGLVEARPLFTITCAMLASRPAVKNSIKLATLHFTQDCRSYFDPVVSRYQFKMHCQCPHGMLKYTPAEVLLNVYGIF